MSEERGEVIDVAVIGSGCAGLSSAMVSAEYGYKTVVFSGPQHGGVLNVKTIVGNWPGKSACFGNEIMKDLIHQATQFGAQFESKSIVSCDFSKYPFELQTDDRKVIKAFSVVIATGTRESEPDIPGFAEYVGKGIWTNPMVYANLDSYYKSAKNRDVLIVGSGVDAMKKAAYASRAGSRRVWISVRENDLKISALRKRLMKPFSAIEILPKTKILSFQGDGGRLKHVSIQTVAGIEKKEIGMAVMSIGRVPNSELFDPWISTDGGGRILLEKNSQSTNIQGVFAAGDVTISGEYGQGAIAASDGMKAGYEVVSFLREKTTALSGALP